MQSTTSFFKNLVASDLVGHPLVYSREILAFSKDVADKFESQEKEIDYLKKNALAQEMKINELSKLVDVLIVAQVPPRAGAGQGGECIETTRAWGEILTSGNGHTPENNERFIASGLSKERYGLANMGHKIILAKRDEIKEKKRKANEEVARLQVEAHEKIKAEELAEKKEKAMKDMMARVALLEETAKKEEDELENLKLISEPKTDEEIEDPEIQELLMREANALARAAEMRAEKAKLRGTKKSKTKTSIDPSTWSDAKCAQMSDGWCE
jgi:hypothetical protein